MAFESRIEARGLTVRYGPVTALDSVDIDVPPGITGLLGPNGAGKTTLIRVILGLRRPESGRVRVLDLPLPEALPAIRARIGFAPETDSRFPAMTAVDAVTFAGVLCGMPRAEAFKQAHALLDAVGLDEARYRRTEQLSTGMRQRLRIACALVHRPELVILDEPTSGLDASARDEILDRLAELQKSRVPTMILSTHILSDVERLCSHVIVLHEGRRVAAAPVRELVAPGTETFEVRIAGDGAAFRRELEARSVVVEAADTDRWRVRAPDAAARIFPAAVAAGATVLELRRFRSTLEDVFLRLVR